MKEEVCALVGIPPNDDDGPGFHLDLEDYLTGLTQLSNELSRFAVNSVTQGDYSRPIKISSFLNDLLNGFRLLNLKNDGLRYSPHCPFRQVWVEFWPKILPNLGPILAQLVIPI